jgi:hypothetical protein
LVSSVLFFELGGGSPQAAPPAAAPV